MPGHRFSVTAAASAFEDALDGFEPSVLSGSDAAKAVKVLARVERLAATARARAAARVEACGAHREQGFTRASDWLAHETGVPTGVARREIETAKAIEDMADTKEALANGQVSLAEAEEIAKAPEAEDELLDLAKGHDHRKLRERARRRRLESEKSASLRERRRAARGIRTWTDDLGMRQVRGALLPELAEPFIARLQAESERLWQGGARDSTPDQRLHDAFFSLLGDGERPSPRASGRIEMAVVWDLNADRAHIPGVGPIDEGTLADLAKDAFVTGVLHDGEKVDAYRRFGRSLPRWLEVLLRIGDPPHFEGARCHDCGAVFAFERDHVDPVANGGVTSYSNTRMRCPPCHRVKTEADREAGLLGRAQRRNPHRRNGRGNRRGAKAGRDAGHGRRAPP